MEKVERNYMFDNLKALLIFLVVIGHVIEPYKGQSLMLKSLYTFVYFFHMPLFIFISGYFSKNLEKTRDKAVGDVLLLYVVFNILWSFFVSFSATDFNTWIKAPGLTILNSITGLKTPGWVLWYLLSLFTWRIFLKDLLKVRFILPLSFIVALLCGGVSDISGTLSLSRTICFLPFFLIGYFIDEKSILVIKRINPVLAVVGIFLIALLAFEINNLYKGFRIEFLYFSTPYSVFKINLLTGAFYRFLLYLVATGTSIFIISVISDKKQIFSYIGQNALTIFILHAYVVKILSKNISILGANIFYDLIIFTAPIIITIILASKPVVVIFDKFIKIIKRGVFA